MRIQYCSDMHMEFHENMRFMKSLPLVQPNVGYYHNNVVHIDNVDFILSTLWSRIPVVDEFAIQNGMNDY